MSRTLRAGLWLTSLLVASTVARAQSKPKPPEYQGLTAGLLFGATDFRLDDAAPPPRFTGGLHLGYRIRLFGWGHTTWSLTPQFMLAMTQFRGISLNSTEIGYSRFGPGLQLAVRTGAVRPYLLYERGTSTVERYVGSDLMNYYGKMPAYGIGIELPFNNPCGSGFNLAVRRTTGMLDTLEWRPPTPTSVPAPGGSVGSTIVTLGWSGRFRGSHLLFSRKPCTK